MDLRPPLPGRGTTTMIRRSPNRARCLCFLAHAYPNFCRTCTVSLAGYSIATGTQHSCDRRCDRDLRKLLRAKIVSKVTGPSLKGRSPNYWRLTTEGLEVAVQWGLITREQLALKARSNVSAQELLRRRHEQVVCEVAAMIRFAEARTPALSVPCLLFDRSTSHTVQTPKGDLTIVPDLCAVLRAGGQSLLLLCEVQTTAPALKHSLTKVRRYKTYLKYADLDARYRCSNSRVLFISVSDDPTGTDHLFNILETIAVVPGLDGHVLGSTHLDILAHGPLAPIFRTPQDIGRALSHVPEQLRRRLADAARKSNATRARRNRLVLEHTQPRRVYE